jgi:hypothetical protein
MCKCKLKKATNMESAAYHTVGLNRTEDKRSLLVKN